MSSKWAGETSICSSAGSDRPAWVGAVAVQRALLAIPNCLVDSAPQRAAHPWSKKDSFTQAIEQHGALHSAQKCFHTVLPLVS